MSLELAIGRDGADRPVVSVSVVMDRHPLPDERLRDLVQHAVVAVDLVASDDEVTLASVEATVALPGDPVTAAGHGPFGQVALSFTLEGRAAGDLLQGLVEGRGPMIRLRATTRPGPAEDRRVRIRLGKLWDVFDARLPSTGLVGAAGLARHLEVLVRAGAMELGEVPREDEDRRAIADLVLRRATGVVTATGPLGSYRLTDRRPGDTEVTATIGLPGCPGSSRTVERSLGELMGAAGAGLAAHLSIVTVEGGRVAGLVPSRALAGTRAGPPGRPVMLRSEGRLEPAALAVGAELLTMIRPERISVGTHLAVIDTVTLAVPEPGVAATPGPVVGAPMPAFWPDRDDPSTFWYVPEYVVVLPDPTSGADASPYRFDLTPSGHGLDGVSGLEATITVTVAARVPDDVSAAWVDAGEPPMKPVVGEALTVQLGIPFRDQSGVLQVQHHLAESVDPTSLVVVFRLMDQWARMAYGALSTPGFQSQPARLLVTSTYGGWRRSSGAFLLAQPDKVAMVLKPPSEELAVFRPNLRTRALVAGAMAVPQFTIGIASTQVSALAKAGLQVHPRLSANLMLQEAWFSDRYEWSRFSSASSTVIEVPCATHGQLYRRVVAGEEPAAVGCQDVLRLGQAVFRTYEPTVVEAARGHARVLRSLTRPGHFVLVPERYRVGRFGADAGERAFQPQLLLTSVLDPETAALRAVLAATLEADVTPMVRSAIVDELGERSPHVVLDLPWSAGLTSAVNLAVPGTGEVQCVATPTGFAIVLSLDVSDFLVVKAMLETAGLNGGATLVLPDATVASTLRLSLSELTGPYSTGPVTVRREGGAVELVNRIGSRVAILSLRAAGGQVVVVDQVLGAGASTRVQAPRPAVGEYDVEAVVESTRDTLEEVRVYVEDLEVEVVFVLTGTLGAAVALEVMTTFDGRTEPEPTVLTAATKQGARRYLLPLTTYLADPRLRFVVTSVAADGTRTSSAPIDWALRRDGAVIPVATPVPST